MPSDKPDVPAVKFLWTHYVLMGLFVLGVLVYVIVGPPPPIDTDPLHILQRVDAFSVRGNNANAHNLTLLSVLQQKNASAKATRAASESGAMQARIIFASFLAALVSLASKLVADKINWQIYAFFLFLIALMFFLDVLHEDAAHIHFSYDSVTEKEIHNLANASPADTSWYVLSYNTVNARFDLVYDWPGRWARKARIACEPNPERLIFFMLPWLLVYYLACRDYRDKTAGCAAPNKRQHGARTLDRQC